MLMLKIKILNMSTRPVNSYMFPGSVKSTSLKDVKTNTKSIPDPPDDVYNNLNPNPDTEPNLTSVRTYNIKMINNISYTET